MTTVMGRCERCDESAVATYNDHRYCQWHYDEALRADLREAADLIREAMEDYGSSYGRKARHALARAEARVYRALEQLEEPTRVGVFPNASAPPTRAR